MHTCVHMYMQDAVPFLQARQKLLTQQRILHYSLVEQSWDASSICDNVWPALSKARQKLLTQQRILHLLADATNVGSRAVVLRHCNRVLQVEHGMMPHGRNEHDVPRLDQGPHLGVSTLRSFSRHPVYFVQRTTNEISYAQDGKLPNRVFLVASIATEHKHRRTIFEQ